MKEYVLGAEWENVIDWTNDVPHDRYLVIKADLDRQYPGGRWTELYAPARGSHRMVADRDGSYQNELGE